MNTENLDFLHPHFLWLLLLLPVLLFWKGRRGRPAALRLPAAAEAAGTGVRPRSLIGGFRFLPLLLSLALFIIALARPRIGRGSTEVETSGIDILLTLDVSGSMEAMDFTLHGEQANRLEVVKDVVLKFVKERENDHIGVVAFAGRPYLVSPLTMDHDFLAQRIRDIKIGQVEDGTAIGSAIASATRRLKASNAKSRIVILLTDGVNNAGAVSPETSAEAARTMGIKLYAIGAGTQGEAPMPVRNSAGRIMGYRRDRVDIDEPMLQKVAETSGGRYFRATDTDSLESIYESINQLEKTTRKLKQFRDYQELYFYFLLPGLIILLTCWALSHTLWRRLP